MTSLHTFVCAVPSFPSVLWFLSIVVLFDFFEISFHQITQSSSESYFAFPTLKKRIPQYFDRVIPFFTMNSSYHMKWFVMFICYSALLVVYTLKTIGTWPLIHVYKFKIIMKFQFLFNLIYFVLRSYDI